MATSFPGSQDSFTNPSSGSSLSSPSHSQQHADVNDAVEAIEGALLDGAPLHIDDANERVGVGTASPEEEVHVVKNQDGDLTQVLIENIDQRVRIGSYYEAGVGQYGKIQSEQDAGGDVALVLNPEGGNVGVGTTNPHSVVHIDGGTDASVSSGSGYLQIGSTTSTNIVMDDNEIMGRNNGVISTLYVQPDGGTTHFGSNVPNNAVSIESARMFGIRGQLASTNGSNELLHLYNNVNIGYPYGWGGQDAPEYGLHVYGAITTSTHPMFVARSDTNNQEPTSTTKINYAATTANRGNHYDTSTSTFTAPLDGVYEFNLRWWYRSNTTGTAYIYLYVNNAVYGEYRKPRPTSMSDYEQCYVSWKVALSANDAVHIRANGTSSQTFHSSSTNRYSEFSGMLLG